MLMVISDAISPGLHCEYDEFTADNSYNRAIRATLDACRNWASRLATQRLWFETHARFASISPFKMSAVDVARLPRDRTTQRYSAVVNFASRFSSWAFLLSCARRQLL